MASSTADGGEQSAGETVVLRPAEVPYDMLYSSFVQGLDRGHALGAHDREQAVSEAASRGYARGLTQRPPVNPKAPALLFLLGAALGITLTYIGIRKGIGEREVEEVDYAEGFEEVPDDDVPDVRD